MSLRRFRNILFTLLTLLQSGVASDISAAIRYKTDLLQRMAAGMQIEKFLDSLGEGDHYGAVTFNSKPLTISIRDSVVVHIGYRVFREEIRSINPSPVYDFLERYFLELDIPYNRIKPIHKQIEEDEIFFSIGSMNMICDLYDIPEVNIAQHGIKGWTVSWRKNNKVVCEVHFKNHYELLNGSEMEENERRLIHNLTHHHIKESKHSEVSIEQLTTTELGIYLILRGESFYTDNLTSNMYYRQRNDKKCELLYTDSLPIESLANLFSSTQIENSFNLHINFVKCNLQKEVFDVPLNAWTDYCVQEGCQPFFGVINQNDTSVKCLVIMKNESMGYVHTLKVEFPKEKISTKEGSLTAHLVSYIPISKIFNLFEK